MNFFLNTNVLQYTTAQFLCKRRESLPLNYAIKISFLVNGKLFFSERNESSDINVINCVIRYFHLKII